VLNQELCEHCHMTITDPRFAAEFVTRTGKILVFDDVGCLTAYLREAHPAGGTAWVFDFVSPDGVLEADKAVYLQTGTIHTPMAGGLLALRPGREADSVRAALGGDLLPWAAAQMRAGRHSPSPPS
jgi:copper chaperone NosL